MSRVQLALNVSNLEEAVAFYSKFSDAEPAKVRPGFANFALNAPPLELVFIEGAGEPGSLDRLGVDIFSTDDSVNAAARLSALGSATDVEEYATCCHAVHDKAWADGPDASRWEVYTVLADATGDQGLGDDERCCTSNSPDGSVTIGPAGAAR